MFLGLRRRHGVLLALALSLQDVTPGLRVGDEIERGPHEQQRSIAHHSRPDVDAVAWPSDASVAASALGESSDPRRGDRTPKLEGAHGLLALDDEYSSDPTRTIAGAKIADELLAEPKKHSLLSGQAAESDAAEESSIVSSKAAESSSNSGTSSSWKDLSQEPGSDSELRSSPAERILSSLNMSDAMTSALTQHDFHEPGEIYDMHQPPDVIVHHDYHYYTTVVQEVYADYNPVLVQEGYAYDYSVQPDLVAPHYDYVVHPSSVVGGYYDHDYHLAHHDVLAPPVALVGAAAVHLYYDYDYRLAHHHVLPPPPPLVASVHYDYGHPLNQVHHDYTTDIVHYASYDYHFDPVVGSIPPVVGAVPGAVAAVVYPYGDYQLYADYPPAVVDTVVYQDYDYSLGLVDYNDAETTVLRPDGSNAVVVHNPGNDHELHHGAWYIQDYHEHHFPGDKESDDHDYHTAFVGASDILANRFLHRKHDSKTPGADYLLEHPWESLKKNKTETKDNAPFEMPEGEEVVETSE